MKKNHIILFLCFVTCNVFSQFMIPQCPSGVIYLHTSPIQVYDPNLPLSATNPSNTNIPGGGGGLSLGPNLNASTPNPTFYTIIGGNYAWWNGNVWVNSGHNAGNGAAVNLGGGGCYIYNLVGATGQVYRYDGTGNGTLILTMPNFQGGGPYDIACDCNGNFYILKTTTANGGQALTKYDPNGVLLNTYPMTGMPNTTAGGGFAVVGNTVYCRNTNGFFIGPITGGTVNFSAGPNIVHPGDFASCPVMDNCATGTISATINNTGPLGCVPNPTANVSITTTLTALTFSWSGPGIVGLTTNSTAVVNQTGIYTCTVTQICPPATEIFTTMVTSVIKPTAAFNYSSACVNMPMSFINTSGTNGGSALTGFVWKWFDGSADATTPSAIHSYTSAGTKTVQLTITNADGCTDVIEKHIELFPSPLVDFTFDNICQGGTSFFHNTTNWNGSIITNWYWDFENDKTVDDTSPFPANTYTHAGQYFVSLYAVTDKGCSDTITKMIDIYPTPIADFDFTKACLGDTVYFTNKAHFPDLVGAIINYEWNFNGNPNAPENILPNPKHLFTTIGLKTITFTVKTDKGCTGTITKNVYVNPNPVVNFYADRLTGCASLPVNFTGTATVNPGYITGYKWHINNTIVSFEPNTFYEFPAGQYTVALTASSDSGCVTKKTINNYIHSYPVPRADYMVTPQTVSILEPVVNFTNLTETEYEKWYWYFGDTGTPDEINRHPVHFYNDEMAAKYMTTLIVINKYGCSDTTKRLVVVDADFVIYFPNAFTPNNDGLNDVFQGKGYYVKNVELDIFDRWGEKIFTSTDINKGWDGNYKGKLCENGVYVWKAIVIDSHSKRHTLTGHVTLMK